MDHFKAMRTFVRIIDEGGFASAARAMDVAPAAVTRALSDLEMHLGTRLIHRTTRRLALTEIGEQYLDRTRAILAEVASAEDLVSSAHNEPRGTLRVRVPAAFAIHQLAKHLPRFHAQFPLVTVEVCTLSAVEDVDEGHDLTILWRHRPLDGDFIARRLACTEVILCASPEYLDRHGRPDHPSELSAHMLLLPPSMNGRPNDLSFTSNMAGEDAQPCATWTVTPQARAPMSTINADLCYAGALSGLGICGLPSFVIEDAVFESALERVLPAWRMHEFTIWACMPTRKHVPARTRALLDFLLQTFGGDPRDPWLNHEVCTARV
ncbi:hypothetical protein ASF45_09095 [Pseudorhodoferax sp. Leaf265]|nr:hypothetical protein ASF45_09095 [Pseudorhodoferax sp. Leaf265]